MMQNHISVSARRVATSAVLLTALLSSKSVGQRADTIILNDGGKNLRGRIQAVSKDGIKIKVGGDVKTVRFDDAKNVVFSDVPSVLRQAGEAYYEQRIDDAISSLARVKTSELKSDNTKLEYAYLKACTKAAKVADLTADPDEAMQLFERFIRNGKSSYHYYPAWEQLGQLKMQTGDFATAAKCFAQVAKAGSDVTKTRGSLQAADALRAQGKSKFSTAVSLYDKIIKRNPTNKEMKRQQTLAVAGRAACVAELGKQDESVKTLKKLIGENDSSDHVLFAKVNNALGASYRVAGKPVDAILAYCHTDLLYFRDATSHAEALYWLDKLFREVGQPERAAKARSKLKSRYGGTAWANRQ